jgi:hypothetical protein
VAIYDPNQQQASWTPPGNTPGYATVPADAQPATGADRWALVALAVSLTVLLSCIPGLNCITPLIVGVVALVQAKNAADPSRARTYGWIATGIGIFILVAGIGIIAAYGAFIASLMNDPNFRRSLER